MSLIGRKPEEGAGKVDRAEKVSSRLVVASGDCSKPFEAEEEALHFASKSIELLVVPCDARVAGPLVSGNDWLEAASTELFAHPSRVVARVSDAGLALNVVEKFVDGAELLSLPRSQRDKERKAFGRGDRVDLGRKTSCRTSQRIAFDPPFPPAAS